MCRPAWLLGVLHVIGCTGPLCGAEKDQENQSGFPGRRLYREIGNNQMLHIPVVSTFDVVGVGIVKGADVEAVLVETLDEGCVLDDQDEAGMGGAQEIGQLALVLLAKGPAFVVGEFRVIGRVQEEKIMGSQVVAGEQIPKILAAKRDIFQ